jgi:hypothetical protein
MTNFKCWEKRKKIDGKACLCIDKGTTPIKSYKNTAFYYESIFWNSKAQKTARATNLELFKQY